MITSWDAGSWIIQSMPHMEHAVLAELLAEIVRGTGRITNTERPNLVGSMGPEHAVAVATPVASLNCPSRRPAIAYPHFPNVAGSPVTARTDYALNAGGQHLAVPPAPVQRSLRGIYHVGGRIGAKDITDGLSHTYLVGEKSMDPEHYETGLDFGDRDGGGIMGLRGDRQNGHVRSGTGSPQRDRSGDFACNARCHEFGSAHPAGWNVVMADGSVHTRTYDVSRIINQSFATISGSETFE